MIELGRICVKLAGRDAGMKCVVVDMLGNNMVMIDGQTRRRKCSIRHLEPLDVVIKIKKGASHSEIAGEFKKLKIETKRQSLRKQEKSQCRSGDHQRNLMKRKLQRQRRSRQKKRRKRPRKQSQRKRRNRRSTSRRRNKFLYLLSIFNKILLIIY